MFVAGCHRSGTSYLSGLLSDFFEVSRNSDIDRTVDNPRGYFESTLLGPFNDQLLSLVGASWDRPPLTPPFWRQGKILHFLSRHKSDFETYALEQGWVDKDPRLSITFPAYQHLLLRRVPCVIALRHPFEVAASLYLRDGFSPSKGLLIWYLYNRHCSLFIDPPFDHLVSYESLLAADTAQLEALSGFLAPHLDSMDILGRGGVSRLRDCCMQMSNNKLRRNSAKNLPMDFQDSLCKSIADVCLSIYAQLAADGFRPEVYKQVFATIPGPLIDPYYEIIAEGEPSLEYWHSHEISARSRGCEAVGGMGLSADLQSGDRELDQWIIQNYSELVCSLHEIKQAIASPCVDGAAKDSSPDDDYLELQNELSVARAELAAFQRSTLWRFFAPLRRWIDAAKHLRRKIFLGR